MPTTGRSLLLLRRFSSGENKLKSFNLNQSHNKDNVFNPVCNNRDYGHIKRFSCLEHYNQTPQLSRSFSDNVIRSTPSLELEQIYKNENTNQLINEKSLFLHKHADDYVNWYCWSHEAIEIARRENKLIYLLIGSSSSSNKPKDSYDNQIVAKIMNKNFVNIIVDYDERPDIERLYSTFIKMTVGELHWPLSLFLTPDLLPFAGHSCDKPEDISLKIYKLNLYSETWHKERKSILEYCKKVNKALRNMAGHAFGTSYPLPDELIWHRCAKRLLQKYKLNVDTFGEAPQFVQSSAFNFLFHYYARTKCDPLGKECLELCTRTLTELSKSVFHDHVSGGFAHYSIEGDRNQPCFAKTLPIQAQLIVAYTDAFLATKDLHYAEVVHSILKYVNRDLRHKSDGYYSGQDTFSYPTDKSFKKQKGAFYVWEYKEIESLLACKKVKDIPYITIFASHFNIDEKGNITPNPKEDPHGELLGKNVLNPLKSKEESAARFGLTLGEFDGMLSECLNILHVARQKRPRPDLDSKIVCSWNGLMIAGLSIAGQGLEAKEYVDDAIKTAEFVKKYLYNESTKTLIHCCYGDADGSIAHKEPSIKGFLDDYAYLIRGLLNLYEASLDLKWLNWAKELQQTQNKLFWDPKSGGYFICTAEDKSVITRMKAGRDADQPSGNSVSCHNLLRLAAYNDKSTSPEGGEGERKLAKKLLESFSERLTVLPNLLPEMVSAHMFYYDTPTQVLIAGGCTDPRTLELVRVVRSRLLPGRVLAVADPAAEIAVLSRIRTVGDVPTAYVCRRYACSLPVTDVKQLETLLDEHHLKAPKAEDKQEPDVSDRTDYDEDWVWKSDDDDDSDDENHESGQTNGNEIEGKSQCEVDKIV